MKSHETRPLLIGLLIKETFDPIEFVLCQFHMIIGGNMTGFANSHGVILRKGRILGQVCAMVK